MDWSDPFWLMVKAYWWITKGWPGKGGPKGEGPRLMIEIWVVGSSNQIFLSYSCQSFPKLYIWTELNLKFRCSFRLVTAVHMSGWKEGGWQSGGGASVSKPAETFSTSVCAARLKMRQNMEVEWQIGEGERAVPRVKPASWHMYSQQKVFWSSTCSADPARLRTELDRVNQEAAESGLNMKGQTYCMSKHSSGRAPITRHPHWVAATYSSTMTGYCLNSSR